MVRQVTDVHCNWSK
jgi:hypothetical protein